MVDRGQHVVVTLRTGDSVSGWLFAETPLGIYVALDREGQNVRFVPKDRWGGTSYSYDDVVEFLRTPDDLNRASDGHRHASKKLAEAAETALERFDYNAIRRVYTDLAHQASRFRGWQGGFTFVRTSEEDATLGDVAVTVRTRYVDLLRELERCGLDRVLEERSDELRAIAHHYGLPYFDLAFAGASEDEQRFVLEGFLLSLRDHDLVRELDFGRLVLPRVTNLALALLPDVEEPLIEERPGKEGDNVPRRLRKAAAVGRVAVGSALAAANVTAGVFAGIVAALPTLGLATMAGAVSVVTSTYTGLNAACDGLKDLADAIK
jgi:hypothetical protein